jgi:sugar lactone lactonase YvrE
VAILLSACGSNVVGGGGSLQESIEPQTDSPFEEGNPPNGNPSPGPASIPDVSLLAGGRGGAGSLNGIGSAARFNGPQGVVATASHIFVADTGNAVIRKVERSTGEVTTLAGKAGVTGAANGVGTTARFSEPTSLVLRGNDLFVSDRCSIRRIDLTTTHVTTFAGEPYQCGHLDGFGTAARFELLHGIASDGSHLYLADSWSHTIRKVTLANAQVTTIAGLGGQIGSTDGVGTTARFQVPYGVTLLNSILYITDTYNSTIRSMDLSTGLVQTLVGVANDCRLVNGTGSDVRFCHPKGISHDGTALYVSDSDYFIRKIVISPKQVTTIPNTFHFAQGIAWTDTGLIVANMYQNTILSVDLGSMLVTKIAGSAADQGGQDGTASAARFMGPSGIVTIGSFLYSADSYGHTIRKTSLLTDTVTTVAGSFGYCGDSNGSGQQARFWGPGGVASDGLHLYVSDKHSHTIRKIVLATGQVSTLAGTPSQQGAVDGPGSQAKFRYPNGLAVIGNFLYIADSGNATLRKIDLSTAMVSTVAGSPGESGVADGTGSIARFREPTGLVASGSFLYISDLTGHTIRRMDITTSAVTTLAGRINEGGGFADGVGMSARFRYPSGLVIVNSTLLVADSLNSAIRKINLSTGEVTTMIGVAGEQGFREGSLGSARLNTPGGLALDTAGNLFVTDSTENHIVRIRLP